MKKAVLTALLLVFTATSVYGGSATRLSYAPHHVSRALGGNSCERSSEGPYSFPLWEELCIIENPASGHGTNQQSWQNANHTGELTLSPYSLHKNSAPGVPSYDIPLVVNKRVRYYLRYFQSKKGRKFFSRWLERSPRYLPMAVEILREEGLPEDLAFIAMIESGFNPHAYSSASAVGVWQFMPRTGRYFGLDSNWWVDERRDPEKASRAAAKYLKILYKRFNSWELAAASYNAGEGRVARALKKYKTDDYWELVKHKRSLKLETRDYVPKFMAAMMIAKNPEHYGFTDIDYEEPVYYDKALVNQPTDIRVIARAAETTAKEIRRLNPELKRWLTPPGTTPYEIRIPEGNLATYTSNMEKIPKGKRLDFHRHKILSGQSLWDIARAYRTGIKPIMELNNIKNARKIRAGKTLMIPVRAGTKIAKNYKNTKKTRRHIKNAKGMYTVKRGDTLWDISRAFGVGISDLKRWNKLPRSGKIKTGERLYLKEARLIKK